MEKRLILMALLFLAACSDKSDTQNNHAEASSATVTRTPEGLIWEVPAGWIEEQPTSSMRKAQYRLPKVDGDPEDASVVIFYFQGGGGGVRANLDRWISQFKPRDENVTRTVVEEPTTEVNGLSQTLVDVSGTFLFQARPMSGPTTEKPGFRMLATVIETDAGPWFVKFVGPQKTVAKWENSFREFLASFRQG